MLPKGTYNTSIEDLLRFKDLTYEKNFFSLKSYIEHFFAKI